MREQYQATTVMQCAEEGEGWNNARNVEGSDETPNYADDAGRVGEIYIRV